MVSSEHKKCCKGPITCPNNCGVDSGPQINESQNEILCKIINSSILVELQKDIATIRKEVTQSIQIAKECSEKVNKQNDATLLDRLCNIRSYLTIAVLIIAILIALLLQSPHGMSEHQMVEHLNSLQANVSRYFTIELNKLSLWVSKLQATQHNALLFNKEAIRGMDDKLNETKEQLNSLQDNVSRYIISHFTISFQSYEQYKCHTSYHTKHHRNTPADYTTPGDP